jgi:hypothetical protein
MGLIESKSQLVVLTKQWTNQSFLAGSSFPELGSAETLFVADRPYMIVSVIEKHTVAAGSTTLQLLGVLGSTTLGSAPPLLASTIPIGGTVNIYNQGILFGSAVLSTSTPLGTTAIAPVLGLGDSIVLQYTTANLLPPVGCLTVVLQTI